jgi:hypothetical protein
LFVIAKEPWRLRQSTGAIDQLDRHVASLLAMTIAKMVRCPITQRLGVGPRSRNDRFENTPSFGLDKTFDSIQKRRSQEQPDQDADSWLSGFRINPFPLQSLSGLPAFC